MPDPAPDPPPANGVTVFGPNPLLSVVVEDRGTAGDDVHLHPAGQGVWVARMAAALGAEPVLCGLAGGETGMLLRPLLERLPVQLRLVETAGGSGCYVQDRRDGRRALVSQSLSPPPSRHELDELFSATTAAALNSRVLVVCNPFPGDTLPLETYGSLVSDVRKNGTPVIVDLSSPRLDSALEGAPDLVKLNDWELAQFVSGPVGEPEQLRAAAERLRDAGAAIVVVTRGEQPAYVLEGERAWILDGPSFERGFREGCGDSMMGAVAAALADEADWRDALITGAAAGAANFLRHGLGTGSRQAVDDLRAQVSLSAATA